MKLAEIAVNYGESTSKILSRFSFKINFQMSLTIVLVAVFYTPDVGNYLDGQYEFGEELMKALSVYGGGFITLLYTPIFAIVEFGAYILKYGESAAAQGLLWNYIFFRIFCMLFHILWLMLHIIGYRYAKKEVYLLSRIAIRFITFMTIFKIHIIHNDWLGDWLALNIFGIP